MKSDEENEFVIGGLSAWRCGRWKTLLSFLWWRVSAKIDCYKHN